MGGYFNNMRRIEEIHITRQYNVDDYVYWVKYIKDNNRSRRFKTFFKMWYL